MGSEHGAQLTDYSLEFLIDTQRMAVKLYLLARAELDWSEPAAQFVEQVGTLAAESMAELERRCEMIEMVAESCPPRWG